LEKNLLKLQIHHACEDTCPECFILKCKFKYLDSRWQDQDKVSVSDDVELPENIAANGSLLLNANLHDEQA
jgi:hypothetical protein